ncbi:S8 family peptidase [Mycetocola saprophilus]|uniref:S8 family peptidase n=1 Tax=Mycetocola saprophilus TaxID=76636 RepID=UPI0009DF43A0|nr:S8 family peptidase [Mycetocola saprophilus]
MSSEARPLLALGNPEIGSRKKQKPAVPPAIKGPGAVRQGERLAPQFQVLADSFAGQRAKLHTDAAEEIDPELVLVFELAGTVQDFRNAVNRIPGFEFLVEAIEEEFEPDEDFYIEAQDSGRIEQKVSASLNLVMSNRSATSQLISLFSQWVENPSMKFDHGLAKFRAVFAQLRDIRRWGPDDRVKETGLIDAWHERIEVAGGFYSPVRIEIELWFRNDANARRAAESRVSEIVERAGGSVKRRAEIKGISYHSLLVELPVQQVQRVMQDGADAIELLSADEIMFVGPSIPMTVAAPSDDPPSMPGLPLAGVAEGLPRVALLDGLPFVNHKTLAGRLSVDDPDGFGEDYPVSSRHHGTSMASLIIHGDLSKPGEPSSRKLYVRPILRPHEFNPGWEQMPNDELFPDLLHRAILRIVQGESGRQAQAPSVRIVNLSVGVESRALVRKMSPAGRLLDWLAVELNLLFIVSAGNHPSTPLSIPVESVTTAENATTYAVKAARTTSRLRGILSPGDSFNALTVSATHADEAGALDLPDDVWDLTGPGMPAHYAAVGPGVGRSIKPDIYHAGGRALYLKPLIAEGEASAELRLLETPAVPPGTKVAAPGRGGKVDTAVYTFGTSNATALVTREADRVFEILEAGAAAGDPRFPDPLYHPVLAKALIVHASSWGDRSNELKQILEMSSKTARRELTALLGYGALDIERLGMAATNRAVLLAGGSLEQDQRHTYQVPLPPSLRSVRAWHRVTVTLAYMARTSSQQSRYRGAKVFFESPDKQKTGGKSTEGEFHAVKRGSCQHEIFEGHTGMLFGENGTLPIDIQRMKFGGSEDKRQSIRYGLVVSIETSAETSTSIHDEVRAVLRQQVRTQSQQRVQS